MPTAPGSARIYTDAASLGRALRFPVRSLAWSRARLTYRMRHEGGPVSWTTHPGAYAALRGSCAAFSPREYEAAVAAAEGGAVSPAYFARWVARKLREPGWRLTPRDARLDGKGLGSRIEADGWWPGAEWCPAHELAARDGWTVGYACAFFGLVPESVEIHPAEREEESRDAAE